MDTCESSRRHLIALNSGENLARDSICRLAKCLGTWISSSEATPELAHRLGVTTADMTEAKRLIDSADSIFGHQQEKASAARAQILISTDAGYPAALNRLELPPPVLYIRGQLPDRPAIGIVGSRQATRLGLEAAELFGRELAARGLTVVSGFARGVDLAAHRGALNAPDGRTVAVLGCGLDVDYPRGRHRFRHAMTLHGALVSEFPFGAAPRTWNFPIRNRIIAALSLGVLVVEGTPRSGSLITARLALDLGRDIYAIPGSIFERRAAGPNRLIQDGALLVQSPADIEESLPLWVRESLPQPTAADPRPTIKGLPGEILKSIPAAETVTAEHLSATTGRPLDEVLGILLELELAGLVVHNPGASFSRKP